MSYLEYKLTLEMTYFDTFGKDDKVKKMYEKYLKEHNEQQNDNRNRREQGTK